MNKQLNLIKPKKLREGDTVALITLAWGGASECKERYEQGKKQLEKTFKVIVKETPNALKPNDWIYNNPQERLNDLIWAFKNQEIKAIFTIIGGDDSVRLLEYLTPEHIKIMKNNSKIFVGFSDTTVVNFICLKAGIVSFYGPSVLFGMAENLGMHQYTVESMKNNLFSSKPIGQIENSKEWTIARVPWTGEGNSIKRKMQKGMSWKFLQGKEIVEGKLIGGCMDTLEILKGTSIWPSKDFWKDIVLLIETSEEKPSPSTVEYWLRNYGAQGILQNLKGILFGIPGGDIPYDDSNYSEKLSQHIVSFEEYDKSILKVAREFNREDLCIVTGLNFGHTSPMLTFPIGTTVRLNPNEKKVEIIESGVKE